MAHHLSDSSLPLPRTFEFEHLNFANGSAVLAGGSVKTVNDLAAMLRAYPTARMRIEGHTDATGVSASNQPLSKLRADALKQALIARGIRSDRIETTGEGALRPAPGNESEPQAPGNRRASVVLLSR
jgi:outer membrane protein OmpA-like peptidoglycan-associated protein